MKKKEEGRRKKEDEEEQNQKEGRRRTMKKMKNMKMKKQMKKHVNDDLMLFSSFCVPCVSLHSRNISRGIAKTLGQVLRMGQVRPVFFLERLQRSGVIKLSILGPGTVP